MLTFAAAVADRFGNPRTDAVTWSVAGTGGTLNPGGRFTATAAGTAVVIGRTGSLADTAIVLVTDPASGVRVTAVTPAPGVLRPGGPFAELARLQFTNGGGVGDTLATLELADVSHGPPDTKYREISWSSFELRNEAQQTIAVGTWEGDVLRFENPLVPIPAGGSRTLTVSGAASVAARDGDSLGVVLKSADGVTLRSGRLATLLAGAGATRPAVDGMTSAQVTFVALSGRTPFAGARRKAVAYLRVPGNGYDADRLLRLNLANAGTAQPDTDLTRLEAWLDGGDRQLDTLTDQRLGTLFFTGDRWELTGLGVDLPDSGRGVIVSVDVAAGAREGRTIRLALPTLPDVGLGMASGNSGPVDRDVEMDREVVIGGGERVLVTAAQRAGGVVHPGDVGAPLLELVMANGYTTARRLRALTLTNESAGAGTQAQLDGSLSRVGLALHGLLASGSAIPLPMGSFSGGRVTFEGLDLAIPAGGELRLTVWGDVAADAAADGDRLAANLASPQDLEFDEATTVGGTWPTRSGATWTVDGFAAAQAVVHPLPGLTLAPSDGPVAALDVTLPANGYLADVLRGVRVANRGTAAPAEIAELRLYRDGGDGRLGGPGADDTDLGALVRIGGLWQSAYLSEPVPVGGRRYFVGLTVAATTSDSSLVRLAIPTGGVDMDSGDDGPLDVELANPEPHVLSTRPLLASLELDATASTIGQRVDVRLTVRNVGTETFDGVAPGALVAEGTAAHQLLSGPTPASTNIAPGGSAIFTWALAPTTAGDLRFATTATGTGHVTALPRQTLVAHSGTTPVYTESDSLRLVAMQSMPSAVTLGQAGVVPITLTLEHPGDENSTPITFRRLRVRLEQEDGSPIVPAQLAAAVEVREGTTVYLRRTSLETSGGEMDLALTTPVALRPGDPVSIALRLDLSTSTPVPSFRLVIPDSTGFVAEDAISGRPVRVQLQDQAYPIRSGLARVLAGGGALALVPANPATRHATEGQSAVTLASWPVAHSSAQPTSADLRLNAILLRAQRLVGSTPKPPWARWRVFADDLVVAVHDASVADTGDVRVDLVPAPIVQPGTTTHLRIEADLASDGAGQVFRLDGVRTAQWDVRDVNTGDAAAVTGPGTLAGDTLHVESPATELRLSPVPRLPAVVAAGRTHLPALDVVVRHPGVAGAAAIRVDSLRVSLQAPDGRALAWADDFSALRVMRRGVPVASLLAPSASFATFPVGTTVAAADTDTLTIELDVLGAAGAGTVEVRVFDGGVRVAEANTGLAVAATPEPPAGWPFGSGATQIVAPARELRVRARSTLPALVAPHGNAAVDAALLVLQHPGPGGSGPIALDHLVMSAVDDAGTALDVGEVASSLEVWRGGVRLATSAALTPDSTTAVIALPVPVEVAALDSTLLELSFVPRATDAARRFRLGWRAEGIGVVQPTSAVLAIAVLAAPGASFPMWTETAGFTAADLASSWTNFPNPFAAGRGSTTFAFLMPTTGRATLRIWTPRGEPVVTLLESASLAAGLRQSDRWDGRNGRGAVVANGVYVAELDVTLDDGRHERVLRKVAVVR